MREMEEEGSLEDDHPYGSDDQHDDYNHD
jgi:hypothetical protein